MWADDFRPMYLYVLRCSVTGRIRYIGQTYRPAMRRTHHFCRKTRIRNPVDQWIADERRSGRQPTFHVVASQLGDIGEMEREWINRYRAAGEHLFNVHPLKSRIRRR